MFPYRDDNPTLATPIVTMVLIAANVLVWVFIQGMGMEPSISRSVCELGLIPGEVLGRLPPGTVVPVSETTGCRLDAASWHTAVTSMFLHGGWLHLIGNVWFLWVFGNNVEDAMGRARYLAFYLLTGLAAAAAQTFANPASPVPMVGASGAISGIMGGYIVLYPRVRVHMIVFLGFFITRIAVPAMLMLGYWFVLQLFSGWASQDAEGGVAFWAHAGGFIAGAVLVLLFRRPQLVARHRSYVQERYGYVE